METVANALLRKVAIYPLGGERGLPENALTTETLQRLIKGQLVESRRENFVCVFFGAESILMFMKLWLKPKESLPLWVISVSETGRKTCLPEETVGLWSDRSHHAGSPGAQATVAGGCLD